MSAGRTPEVVVAVVQTAPGDDPASNRRTITDLTEEAVRRGAQVAVFPEYSSYFSPDLGPAYLEAAESTDGPFVRHLTALADRLGVVVVAGLVAVSPDPARFENLLVAVAPGRGVVARYSKQHLYDAFGGQESRWIVPGPLAVAATFEVGGLVFGLQTCYDLRFPEVTRTLVDAGADVVLMPAEWVRGPLKQHHWTTLLTARALENTVYVAAADHAPPIGVGCSTIVDPTGVAVASVGDEVDVMAVAGVSADRIAAVRRLNPSLALRRYDVVPRRVGAGETSTERSDRE
ncbi:carbon-nitrogen hydrolase family protein [Frigoribacterium sp. CFBP 8759]|uniref:carbon-nitrogen hydrolase family protein n=1 Tax=unclassified Frigoribacterium TaxID=2627005 RepID=UPI0006FA4BFC|nr:MULTISPECIES: carbon-nitrogen hydrolase family protein [unclassified Frigoribacterium]KQM24417.1 hydrolase [Frigoribacterium sp. Leaf8]MBD8484272.1 carbon-nitrogen hydrolase family protein [Frigoribacterium sp. CFBP 8759]ROS50897.1 putative amidohydrolase [Frigoribacterium sp. PhB118]